MNLSKGHYGWTATTEVPVGERTLQITTMKRSGGFLGTIGTVGIRKGISFSFVLFEDFSKTLASEDCRCTKNAVITQHNAVMSDIDTVIAQVNKYYEARVEPA